jgi:alkylated DNA nucleotide flippase Atl1
VARKTAREKLNRPAEITAIPPMWEKRMGKGRLLIPAPADLESLVWKIPRGRYATQGSLREQLARAAGVEATCPLTTGIFLRLIAEASEEEAAAGGRRVAPWWRVVRDDGKLWDKSPGGVAEQARRLTQEGIEVLVRRGVPRVAV